MKKIAFITPSYYPAILTGSGLVVKTLAEEFAKKGYAVSVITSNALTTRYWYDPIFGEKIKNASEVHNGVKIYRLPCWQIYSSACFIVVKIIGKLIPKNFFNKLTIEASGPYLRGLKKLLQAKEYHVIHCSPTPLAINRQVVRLVGTLPQKPKLIITPFFHSEVAAFTNPELKKVFDAADRIHTITDQEKKIISHTFGVHKEKIQVIPLFLETRGMHTIHDLQEDIDVFKHKYHLEKRIIILFAGIKGHAKGATSLLLAIDKLYRRDKKYILIAMGTDTKEWMQTKKMIDPKCLLDFSYKMGKEKETIFAASDIFCMPSKSESFGLVYLEAWAKKKPVIAASTPAVREFLKKNAVFVPFGNTLQIGRAIQRLSESKNTQKNLGENGYNTLMTTYTFQKIFSQYVQLFTT